MKMVFVFERAVPVYADGDFLFSPISSVRSVAVTIFAVIAYGTDAAWLGPAWGDGGIGSGLTSSWHGVEGGEKGGAPVPAV